MTKEEFLRILKMKISGTMAPEEAEEQIKYYASYIDGLIAQGKTEAEAVEELGDPVLIAKTLKSAKSGNYMDEAVYSEESIDPSVYEEAKDSYQESCNAEASAYSRTYENETKSESWIRTKDKVKVIAILVAALVIAIACIVVFFVACFQVGGCILGGLLPIIIVLVILGLIYSIFRR